MKRIIQYFIIWIKITFFRNYVIRTYCEKCEICGEYEIPYDLEKVNGKMICRNCKTAYLAVETLFILRSINEQA